MLEHLTLDQATAALDDWFHALVLGGRLRLAVPDLDFYVRRWLGAKWDERTSAYDWSEVRAMVAGFYGSECQSALGQPQYDPNCWRVHKSGYNERLLHFLIAKAGFANIEVRAEGDAHLRAVAQKVAGEGERQVAPTPSDIRSDHTGRYRFAATHIPEEGSVLDIGCGVGYGSWLIAEGSHPKQVLATDRDPGAIEYARQFYSRPEVQFEVGDALEAQWATRYFDAAVALEVLEHVLAPEQLLRRVHRALKPGGRLVCSTPNQDRLVFDEDRFPFHRRHYTPTEFQELVEGCGFGVDGVYSQPDRHSERVVPGSQGLYLLIVATKGSGADSERIEANP